jgi:hypothetical protein
MKAEMEAEGVQPVTPSPVGNIYAQMREGSTPIEEALAAQEDATISHQAQAQEQYMKRQEAIRQFEAQHPEARVGSDLMREEAPLWDPYLKWRTPPVAAREEAPKQEMGSGFAASYKMGMLKDPETRRRVLAQTLFPNDPDAIYRVGFDANGDPVYVGDDNKLHKIASGTEAFAANLAANAPETVMATVGAFGGPGASGLGAAGAHGIKRGVAGLIWDEPQEVLPNLGGMAVEGVTAAGGEMLGRGYIAARNMGRMNVEFPADEIARAQAVIDQVRQRSNINLNLADATDDPFIKAVYQYGWRQSGQPSRDLRAARGVNDLEYQAETDRVLNQIAGAEPSERSGQRAVNAAEEAMRRAQTRANDIADPYYQIAYGAHPVIRDPTVLSFFNLPGFGAAFDQGQVLAAAERHALQQYQPPDLRSMDYMLRALRRTARNLRSGENANKDLAGAMDQRIGELDEALSQAYPELRDARTVYRTARMALVEPLEHGKVGVLAEIPDPEVRTAAAKIFSDKAVSPEHVAETRAAIEQVNPAAWSGVVRQWLGSKWDESLQRTQSAERRNAPGKMQAAVFGTPRDEEIARVMLTPAQYQSFHDLMYAAQRLASTPVGGSTTPQDLAIGKALEGNINLVMSLVNTVRHPFKTGEDVARKAGRERNIDNLIAAILDPAQARRLQVITRMAPGRQQAILLGTILSEEGAKRFIQSEMADGENTQLVAGEEEAVGVEPEPERMVAPEWWKKTHAISQ